MEFVVGIIGVLAIILGVIGGYQLSQLMPDLGAAFNNPVVALMQYAGPISLVLGGIMMLAFASGLSLLRQIRNHAERTAAYLSNIARSG